LQAGMPKSKPKAKSRYAEIAKLQQKRDDLIETAIVERLEPFVQKVKTLTMKF